MLVFDLDFTLWDAGGTWCDHTQPPYKIRNNKVTDSRNRHIRLYPDVLPLLEELKGKDRVMAVASRTSRPEWARELIRLFNLKQYFRYEEIYPGAKTRHFHQLAQKSGVDFDDMIFFDDEHRNIQDVGALGVQAVFVKNGLTRQRLMDALNRNP